MFLAKVVTLTKTSATGPAGNFSYDDPVDSPECHSSQSGFGIGEIFGHYFDRPIASIVVVVASERLKRRRHSIMYYTIYRDARNEWRWNFKAANHEIIAVSSEGYVNKSDCQRAIDLVKSSQYAPVHES